MDNTTNVVNSRRNFLKKAAYSAPAIIAMGALTAPVTAQASTFVNNTQSVPATSPVTYTSQETIVTQDGTNNVISGYHEALPTGATGSYSLTGTEVKGQVDIGSPTWTWVDAQFGGSTNWFGL